jgi:hypothetical protein
MKRLWSVLVTIDTKTSNHTLDLSTLAEETQQ